MRTRGALGVIAALHVGLAAACSSAHRTPRGPSGPTVAPGIERRYTYHDRAIPAGSQEFSGTWQVRPEADAPSPKVALCLAECDRRIPGDRTRPGKLRRRHRDDPVQADLRSQDQAAGIIARVVDARNYYILRANALEGNVKSVHLSQRHPDAARLRVGHVRAGTWHQLRLEATVTTLTGFLDAAKVVTATDARLAIGRVGPWTKADSVTCFDDVIVSAR